MDSNDKIQLFEDKRIRTAWDEKKEEWIFFRAEMENSKKYILLVFFGNIL